MKGLRLRPVNSLSYNTSGEIPDLYVFDYVTPETYYLPYFTRWRIAQETIKELKSSSGDFNFLKPVPMTQMVNTTEEVLALHLEAVALGFEGSILRSCRGVHKNGRSTVNESFYVRIKDFSSEEAEVIGFTEAEENLNPLIYNALGQAERSTSKAGTPVSGMIFRH